ncbi:hypothetical protein, partial [Teichococcus cervicalis]
MTGTTTSSISQVAVSISDFSASPIGPWGSSTPCWQPASRGSAGRSGRQGRQPRRALAGVSLILDPILAGAARQGATGGAAAPAGRSARFHPVLFLDVPGRGDAA